jgi:hypothetical protein
LTIFFAAISAILVFYFRESIKLAHQQRNVSSKLDAYLVHWVLKLFEADDADFKLSSVGLKWAKKYEKCTSVEDVIKLDDEFTSKLGELKNELFLNGTFEKMISNAHAKANESKENLIHVKKLVSEYRRDFIDGKFLPSDSELSVLDPSTTKRAITLKLNIIALLEGAHLIINVIEKEQSQMKSKDELFDLYVCWLKIVRDKQILINTNQRLLSTGVLSLAFHNFFNGL